MQWNRKIKVLCAFMLYIATALSQTWKEDSLTIRQILDTNNLQHITVDSVARIKDSTGVTRLRFCGLSKFKMLPSSIGKLSKLRSLSFERTGLATISPEIGNLKSLEFLSFNSNKIKKIPPEIGNLISLRGFGVISDSMFESLPPEIGKLSSLEALGIKMCPKFTKLPDEICNLKSLESLDLIENKLTELPKDIGNLSSLKGWVGLQNNNLKSLPQSIINLNTAPRSVDVCYNDSLVFTPEQCTWYNIKNYDDYYIQYCGVDIKDVIRPVLSAQTVHIKSNLNTILISIPYKDYVRCIVYDSRGRKIETLLARDLSPQKLTIHWNGHSYANGIYTILLNLKKRNLTITQKIVIVK